LIPNTHALEAAGYTCCPEEPIRGYLYVDALAIEDTASWTEAARSKPHVKRYYLMVGNSEFFSDDLETLERMLYRYAASDGFLESAWTCPQCHRSWDLGADGDNYPNECECGNRPEVAL
jgi:hypothetical protein